MPVALSSPRYGLRWAARIDTPRKHVPRMIAIIISVRAAFRDSGFRKAGTPFDTASTPDSATAPEEKARSSMMNERRLVHLRQLPPLDGDVRERAEVVEEMRISPVTIRTTSITT